MIFSVTQCPRCGIIQSIQFSTLEKAVLRCVSCSRQTKVKKKDGRMLKLHGYYGNALIASDVCRKLKENNEDFASANLYYDKKKK